MSNIINKILYNIKEGKYKKPYKIFIIAFAAVFIIKTAITLSSPKPYLSVKSINKNNVLAKENSNDVNKAPKIVTFEDDKFEYKVRSILGIVDRKIFDEDLKKIESMDLNHNNVENLEGIQYCINLKSINLSHNHIKNIDNLKNLKKLNNINLFNNEVSDISALKDLRNLKKLDLAKNNIKDITSLKDLTNLEELDLYSNQIENIDSVKDLNKLKFLDVSRNKIKDLQVIKDLKFERKKLLYWGNDNQN